LFCDPYFITWFVLEVVRPSISTLSWHSILTVSSAGAYLGVIGGVFNGSIKHTHKIAAFGIWEVSNLTLATWAHSVGQYDLMYMYIFYMGTSTFGLYTHLKKHYEDRRVLQDERDQLQP
jgi:hypothetical protein